MGLTEIKPTGNLTVPCHRSQQATVKNNGGLIEIYMYSSPRLEKKRKTLRYVFGSHILICYNCQKLIQTGNICTNRCVVCIYITEILDDLVRYSKKCASMYILSWPVSLASFVLMYNLMGSDILDLLNIFITKMFYACSCPFGFFLISIHVK